MKKIKIFFSKKLIRVAFNSYKIIDNGNNKTIKVLV